METWSLQHCVVIMLPAKVLSKRLSNSHLNVVGEEGVTTEKRTKLRSTGRGKGGQTCTLLITVLPKADPKYSL